MTSTKDIQNAYILAKLAHKDQVDKSGQPYIGHLERVHQNTHDILGDTLELSFKNKVFTVAYLHDILEDTDTTEEQLADIFDVNVISTVKTLTKKPSEKYIDYLERIRTNPIAKIIKLADLKDNSDLTRLPQITNADIHRASKYACARRYLLDGDREAFESTMAALNKAFKDLKG